MGKIAVDTSFLIDFQRESGTSEGPVGQFLASHKLDHFYVSATALGEFAAGFPDLGHPNYRSVRARFGLVGVDEEVLLAYRMIYRDLKSKGELIGANDLWIAASAVRFDMPLVTRNQHEFARVDGLKVLSY